MYDCVTWLQEVEFIKQDQANIKAQYEQVGVLVPCEKDSLQTGLLCSLSESCGLADSVVICRPSLSSQAD